MALVAHSPADVDLEVRMGQRCPVLSGLVAGEALLAGAPCYIAAADGKVYMSDGTADNEAARFFGITPTDYLAGEPVSLYGPGARLRYAASGLTVGPLFAATTAARFDTAATTGGTAPVAVVLSATDIQVVAYDVA